MQRHESSNEANERDEMMYHSKSLNNQSKVQQLIKVLHSVQNLLEKLLQQTHLHGIQTRRTKSQQKTLFNQTKPFPIIILLSCFMDDYNRRLRKFNIFKLNSKNISIIL